MEGMFYNCKLLKNLDISNLNTFSVTSMKELFNGCSSIKSINLSNFHTENVHYMDLMFYQCKSLLSIYLNSFKTENLKSSSYMFYECHSIESLNLSSFTTSQILNINFMFYNCKSLKILDISNFYFNNLDSNSDLSNGWLFFIYGCPKLNFVNMKYCTESNLKNYLNIISNIKPSAKFCLNSILVPQIEKLIIDSNGIIECPEEKNSSFENCIYYHYYNETEKKYICTKDLKCPKEYYLLIKEKSECISDCEKDDKYNYEFQDECYEYCPLGTKQYKENSFLCVFKENTIQEIENNFVDYITNNNLNDLELKNKKLSYKYNDITFEMTSSHNEKLDSNSTIIIAKNECELKLKKYYNISLNDHLYFFKVIIPEKGKKIPKMKYSCFYPLYGINNALVELNISICQDEKVKIYNKINITTDINKYDINSQYYKSLCYTSDDDKYDLILNDRKEIYNNNNLSICQDNCIFLDYDYNNQAALCSCKIKLNNNSIDIDFSGIKFLEEVKNIYKYMNINVISCLNKLFSINGIKNNIGFYFFIILIIICLILFVLFWKKEYSTFIKNINKIFSKGKNIKKCCDYAKKKMNLVTLDNNRSKKGKKEKNKKRKIKNNTKIKESASNNSILKNIVQKNILENLDIPNLNINQNIYLHNFFEMNQTEINTLSYEEALKMDKRNYLQYYFSLIMINHSSIFTFLYDNDYNPQFIKKYLFFYNFGVYFFVNTLFFTDSTMHKIYLDEGSYNLIYQIPQIIYSNLITAFLNVLLKKLALTESSILAIKQEKNKQNLKEKLNSIKKSLKIRFITFFTISFSFLVFFWFYISCFCAVYKNTQFHLIKDIIISFASSLFTPFGISVFPCILRISALKMKNKKWIYKLSKILQLI